MNRSGALIAVIAGLALGQDFPDWRTPETIAETTWRDKPPAVDSSLIPKDSTARSGRFDSLVWLNIRVNPILSAIVWPLEKVVTPLGRYMILPLEEPALYAEREEVTDRGVKLVQLDTTGAILLYPTMVMDGGTGSRLGGTYINKHLLGKRSYARLGGALTISRDWYASTTLSTAAQGPMNIHPNLRLSGGRSSNQSIWIPGEVPIGSGGSPAAVWEERQNGELGLSFTMGRFGSAEALVRSSRKSVKEPSQKSNMLDSLPDIDWFANGDRGVAGGTETWFLTGIVWGSGSVNLEGTPSEGGKQSMALLRTFDKGGGDAVLFNFDLTRYYLIGDERYAYRKGDLDPYTKLSPATILSLLDPTTLRERLTQRRIMAMHLSARRLWEMQPTKDPVSYFHFPTYGGDAPARAYSGGRLMDNALIGGSLEYRWPIWRYIDGSVFTELAWAGGNWWEVNKTGFAPGWGAGLRFRTPGQFLFRGQIAHGREGASAVVTVSPEF